MAGGLFGVRPACLLESLRSSSLTLLRYMGRWNRGFVKKLAFLAAARLQYASGQAPLVPFTFLGLRPAVRKLVKSPGWPPPAFGRLRLRAFLAAARLRYALNRGRRQAPINH
jgi:hypothetical protein